MSEGGSQTAPFIPKMICNDFHGLLFLVSLLILQPHHLFLCPCTRQFLRRSGCADKAAFLYGNLMMHMFASRQAGPHADAPKVLKNPRHGQEQIKDENDKQQTCDDGARLIGISPASTISDASLQPT